MTDVKLCFMVTSPVSALTFMPRYLAYLQQNGYSVTLVCPDSGEVRDLVRDEGIDYAPLSMRREPSPLNDLASVVAATRLLRKIRPEVLVYATPKASLVGALAGALARVPRRVYELWGLRLETSTGFARFVFGRLEIVTCRLSTLLIANSRSLANRAVALGLTAGKRVYVLGSGSSHGVDTARFSRKANFPMLDENLHRDIVATAMPVVGYVGRLHPDKGIDILIEALTLCHERGVRCQLLLVGNDEGTELGAELEALSTRVPVHFAGHLNDVRPAFSAIDILALPSRREGFPNVVLEAAAMEVPAVVTDATGCIDSVVDGVTGIITPIGDAQAFSDALESLLKNADERLRLGRQARARAEREFNPQTVWSLHAEQWRA